MVRRHLMAMLHNTVNMDEATGLQGPIEDEVLATGTKEMILSFNDLIKGWCARTRPKGDHGQLNYWRPWAGHDHFKNEKTAMAAGGTVSRFTPPPYRRIGWRPRASASFSRSCCSKLFLFYNIKMLPVGRTLTQEPFKIIWERTVRTITREDFTTALQQWFERWEKCACIAGCYIQNF